MVGSRGIGNDPSAKTVRLLAWTGWSGDLRLFQSSVFCGAQSHRCNRAGVRTSGRSGGVFCTHAEREDTGRIDVECGLHDQRRVLARHQATALCAPYQRAVLRMFSVIRHVPYPLQDGSAPANVQGGWWKHTADRVARSGCRLLSDMCRRKNVTLSVKYHSFFTNVPDGLPLLPANASIMGRGSEQRKKRKKVGQRRQCQRRRIAGHNVSTVNS